MQTSTVHHIAKLANLTVTPAEEKMLADQFSETLDVIADLQKIDVANIQPTHQVTGLTNVLREDEVDEARMFTQAEALANAKDTYQGYIVVPQILDQE